jgi:hypothetical protein
LYKLDKKSSAAESGLQALGAKVTQLTERVENLETGQAGDAIRNPLFSEVSRLPTVAQHSSGSIPVIQAASEIFMD